MADSKISGLTAATVVNAADQFAIAQSGASKSTTLTVLQQSIGAGYHNSSTVSVVGGYAADTYLAGSAVTVPVGAWKIGTQYGCQFDMLKTAAGTASFTITLRTGTLGTTGDLSIAVFTFGAGTAAIDQGLFSVQAVFRSIGSGTSATIDALGICWHHLAATGLISTGTSGFGMIPNAPAGFNSTTPTIIGLSVNGGASFSGTNQQVQAFVQL